MSDPYPAPSVEPADGIIEWPAAASQAPPSQGVTELYKPGRFSLKRATLAGVIVLLLAGVATLGGLLVQTRGVLDWQTGQTKLADKRAADTQAKLDDTQRHLTDATTQVSDLQTSLTAARAETEKAKTVVREMTRCAIAFGRSSQDILTFDYEAQQTCADATRDLRGLGLGDIGSSL